MCWLQHAMTLALAVLVASTARIAWAADGDSDRDDRKFDVDDYRQRQGFEFPSPKGPGDVTEDGRIVILSGTTVFEETAPRSRTFVSLGDLPGSDFNRFGASFLKLSPDGGRIAVGNNGGASFDHFQVGVFAFPSLAGTWFEVNSFEGAWINERFIALTAGVFGTPSIVTAFDTHSTDPAHPSNRTIINNIGGASGGIAFDKHGNLFTANGFGTTGPSTTGEIKAFPRAQWHAALHGGPPIDFEANGTVIVTVLSAAPLGFDVSGNLFVGGGDFFGGGDINFAAFINHEAVRSALHGHGPINTGDPAQVRRVDPDPDAGSTYDIIINHEFSELYLNSTTSHAFVYRAR
jgi:hypothetical protein